MYDGLVLWMTGLSGAGKTTIATALWDELGEQCRCIVLDGDDLRRGLNSDLGFTAEARAENIRRVAHVAQLFKQQGYVVVVSVIAPEHKHRQLARDIIGVGFVEVFVATPLHVCEARDVKGLYAKARRGEIPNFTGVSSPFDIPVAPDLVLQTDNSTVTDHISTLTNYINLQISLDLK
jgi:adenylylsulfate kinase